MNTGERMFITGGRCIYMHKPSISVAIWLPGESDEQ